MTESANQLPTHPAAELFPMLGEAEFAELKADIERCGLLEPIWLFEGQIIDGRNRYRACRELGIPVECRDYKGDTPVSFVWSLNGARRHLTVSQRAAIGQKMLPEMRAEARKRQGSRSDLTSASKDADVTDAKPTRPIRAYDQAGEKVGVSGAAISRADYVAKRDPELYKQIEQGQITVTKAAAIVKQVEKTGVRPEVGVSRDPNAASDRAEKARAMAAEGYRSAQIAREIGVSEGRVRQYAKEHGFQLPDQHIRSQKVDPERVIRETVHGLAGYAQGIDLIRSAADLIDIAGAGEWHDSLSESLKNINWLRRKLKEVCDDQEGK